jgi:hypothetical protein
MMTATTQPRPGRNEPCYCGSGKKYKHCHLPQDEAAAAEARAKAAAEAPAETPETAAVAPTSTRAPKTQTNQPWRSTTSRGFVPAVRTPRKAGGS